MIFLKKKKKLLLLLIMLMGLTLILESCIFNTLGFGHKSQPQQVRASIIGQCSQSESCEGVLLLPKMTRSWQTTIGQPMKARKHTHTKTKKQENKQTQTATIKQNSTKVKESLNTESVYVTNHLNHLYLEESCVLKEGRFNKRNND